MNHVFIRRSASLALAFALSAAALPASGLAAQNTLSRHGIRAEQSGLITIVGTDVTIAASTFPYTGQEIRPEITVTVNGTVLTENTHYTLTFADNLDAGTATATVIGIPEGGYQGTVTIPFTIEAPSYTLVEIQGTDVTLDGTEFAYTGDPIEPPVTVTVNGTQLTPGKDYTVTYENNVQPGTGKVTVKGIATASMTLGYTGEVTVEFTITEAADEQPGKPDAPGEPDTPGTPEEDPKPVQYHITKGSGATWYLGSGKQLSFTVDGKTDDIAAVRVNGKALSKNHFHLGDSTVTLSPGFLNRLTVGKYTVTVVFADGKAEGTFLVSDQLDTSNPVTGDSAELFFSFAAALAALGAAAFLLRRKAVR